jgi:hypothetical protein
MGLPGRTGGRGGWPIVEVSRSSSNLIGQRASNPVRRAAWVAFTSFWQRARRGGQPRSEPQAYASDWPQMLARSSLEPAPRARFGRWPPRSGARRRTGRLISGLPKTSGGEVRALFACIACVGHCSHPHRTRPVPPAPRRRRREHQPTGRSRRGRTPKPLRSFDRQRPQDRSLSNRSDTP